MLKQDPEFEITCDQIETLYIYIIIFIFLLSGEFFLQKNKKFVE
jgi:hypothetical protein